VDAKKCFACDKPLGNANHSEADDKNMNDLIAWINACRQSEPGNESYHNGTDIYIPTLEGTMLATVGDWIIRGVKGEFYPCKPDIFALTYEPADEEKP
jgi:hypothetical protein